MMICHAVLMGLCEEAHDDVIGSDGLLLVAMLLVIDCSWVGIFIMRSCGSPTFRSKGVDCVWPSWPPGARHNDELLTLKEG